MAKLNFLLVFLLISAANCGEWCSAFCNVNSCSDWTLYGCNGNCYSAWNWNTGSQMCDFTNDPVREVMTYSDDEGGDIIISPNPVPDPASKPCDFSSNSLANNIGGVYGRYLAN